MFWTAYIDGGSRGNPGPGGAGVQLLDEQGRPVFAGGFFLGRLTNNQAEYRAMLAALELLGRAGAERIAVISDSQLLVQQVNGEYRVKSAALKPIFHKVQQRLQRFGAWKIKHVYREQNTIADQLANEAMDAGANVVRTDHLGLLKRKSKSGRREPAPDNGLPAAGATPVPAVQVRLVKGPAGGACPAKLAQGRKFLFTETTPADLCTQACAAVIRDVLALQLDASQQVENIITVKCAKTDCGAVFEIRPRPDE